MKKIIILLIVLSSVSIAQFSDLVNPYRVVVVSPNYSNVYPRFSTLQNAYTATRDSATASKYFIINMVTASSNITDYATAWKDSIINKSPYLRLASFGQAIGDSIISVTPEEFTLVAGALGLNPLIAGAGLSFTDHVISLHLTNYLGSVLYLDGDSLKVRVQAPIYFTPNLIGLLRSQNSGLVASDSLKIQWGVGGWLYNIGDTVKAKLHAPFLVNDDTLRLDADTRHFVITQGVSPSLALYLDSGLTTGTATQIATDFKTLGFTSAKKLRIADRFAGDGLFWMGDTSLKIIPRSPLELDNDTLILDFNPSYFETAGLADQLQLNLDSGITTDGSGSGVKVAVDWVTLIFNSAMQVVVNPTMAGAGLLMTSGVINIVTNEFAELENDTLKIHTSTLLQWSADSLHNSDYYINDDTTGIPIFATGKIKRFAVAYRTDSGNDTVLTGSGNTAIASTNRIQLFWDNARTRYSLRVNNVEQQTFGLYNATTPIKKHWTAVVEIWQEAQ